MTGRQWIAWKLVCLAHRLHNAEFYQRITVRAEGGETIQFDLVASEYGGGLFSRVGDPDLYRLVEADSFDGLDESEPSDD
jgi:hypothetical protein